MEKFIKNLKFISLFALVLAFVGCDEDDVVLPELTAGFTHTINQDTGTVTFINTSTNATDFTWDFGDGTSSNLINPVNTYPSGTYTIVLEATNVAGASDTFEDTIVISIPEVIAFPISFDNPLVDYGATVFGGTTFQVVENPDANGANPTVTNVGEIVNSGATFEGLFFELGQPLDLSTDNSVRILFWSTTPIDVLMKLEDGNGADVEVTASHGGTGWEELYFTFASSSSYNQVTLFVDGPGTTAGTFYIDDLTQINEADIPCTDTNLEFPIDFDCESIDYATKIVGNVSFTVVDNPELSGINAEASKVGQITNVGAQFENAFFNLDTPIDFSADTGVSLKLFSNSALPILLKFEDGTEADVEDTQMHMGTGWEELTFTLNSAGSYNDMVLFVDGPGTAAGTFYVDDFGQVTGDVGTVCIPETAENIDPANGDLNWTFLTNDASTTFDAFGNTAGQIVPNPVVDIVNSSCNVQQFVKSAGCETFAGLGIELQTALDFTDASTNKVFKMKVLGENQATEVTLRLERLPFPDVDPAVDRVATMSQVGAWEELTFDFSDVDTGTYKSMIIYFERNATCDGDIYYFDDIIQEAGSGGGGGPMPFDDGLLDNGDFQTLDAMDNVTEWIQGVDDTNPAPVTTVAGDTYYSIDITAPTPGSPFNINVSQKLPITAGETYILSFEAWTDAGTGSRSIIAGIGLSGPSDFSNNSQVQNITSTPTRYNLTLQATDANTGDFGAADARVLFDLADEAGQVNIDDVSLFVDGGTGGGGGGGTCPAPPAGDFVADGDFEANAGCWLLFDNGGTTIISTTVSNGGGTNSGQITSAMGANPGIKQERFGIGTIQANTTYVVTFDVKADSADPLANGAILNAFTFSEPAEGSTDPAEQHILVQGDGSVTTNWDTRTYTFTTAGNVGGGLSLLFELVCGGVAGCGGTINIDNVSIVAQ